MNLLFTENSHLMIVFFVNFTHLRLVRDSLRALDAVTATSSLIKTALVFPLGFYYFYFVLVEGICIRRMINGLNGRSHSIILQNRIRFSFLLIFPMLLNMLFKHLLCLIWSHVLLRQRSNKGSFLSILVVWHRFIILIICFKRVVIRHFSLRNIVWFCLIYQIVLD